MAEHSHKRSFKNYLLNRRLQLSYALVVTCLSAAIAVGLGLVIFEQSRFASTQILAGLEGADMDWLSASVRGQIRAELGKSDLALIATMAGFGGVLALVLFVALIVMTHKVAGPLWRMSRYFDQIVAKRLPAAGALRKGDHFQGLFAALSAAMQSLRERARGDLELGDLVLELCARSKCERKGVLADALLELESAQREKREMLK